MWVGLYHYGPHLLIIARMAKGLLEILWFNFCMKEKISRHIDHLYIKKWFKLQLATTLFRLLAQIFRHFDWLLLNRSNIKSNI